MLLLTGVGRAALNCNLDGVAISGVYEPSQTDFVLLSVEPLSATPSSLCAGVKCDFDGNGVAVNVGDLAVFLNVVQTRTDPLNICLNEGDPKDNPALSVVMKNADGSTVSNGASKQAKRNGDGLPAVTVSVSDPNGDLNNSSFSVTYAYNALSFDITSQFSAITGGTASVTTGAGAASPFFVTALARYDATTLGRTLAVQTGGGVADTNPAATGGNTLVLDTTGKRLLSLNAVGSLGTQADLSAAGAGAEPLRWLAAPAADRALVLFGGSSTARLVSLSGALVGSLALDCGTNNDACYFAANHTTGTGYVMELPAQRLTAVNLATGAVTVSASLGFSPNFAAFVANQSSATPEVLIQDSANSHLRVLDGATLAEKTSWPLGNAIITEMVLDSVDNRLIFAGSDNEPLKAVALSDGTLSTAPAVTPRPTSLFLSGGALYAVSNVDLSLRRFNASTLDQQASNTLPSKVSGLAVENGTLTLVLDLLDPPGNASAVISAQITDSLSHVGVGEARLNLTAEAPQGL